MLTGKNLIILHSKCSSMCGMLRRLAYQQLSASGATGSIEFVVSPEVVRDEYVLKHAVAVVIGRPIGNGCKEFDFAKVDVDLVQRHCLVEKGLDTGGHVVDAWRP